MAEFDIAYPVFVWASLIFTHYRFWVSCGASVLFVLFIFMFFICFVAAFEHRLTHLLLKLLSTWLTDWIWMILLILLVNHYLVTWSRMVTGSALHGPKMLGPARPGKTSAGPGPARWGAYIYWPGPVNKKPGPARCGPSTALMSKLLYLSNLLTKTNFEAWLLLFSLLFCTLQLAK